MVRVSYDFMLGQNKSINFFLLRAESSVVYYKDKYRMYYLL